jgi:Ca2+-binding EF-hand superfamily protein
MQIESVLEDDLRRIIQKMDKNGDGYIQYQEFLEEAHKICTLISDLYLKHAFDLFDLGDDLDNIGSIPINLVQSAMCNAITSKKKITIEEWEDFVMKFDENND